MCWFCNTGKLTFNNTSSNPGHAIYCTTLTPCSWGNSSFVVTPEVINETFHWSNVSTYANNNEDTIATDPAIMLILLQMIHSVLLQDNCTILTSPLLMMLVYHVGQYCLFTVPTTPLLLWLTLQHTSLIIYSGSAWLSWSTVSLRLSDNHHQNVVNFLQYNCCHLSSKILLSNSH